MTGRTVQHRLPRGDARILLIAVLTAQTAWAGPPPEMSPARDRAVGRTQAVPAEPIPQPPEAPAPPGPPTTSPPATLPEVFGPGQVRLPLLSEEPAGLGRTPRPTPETLEKFGRYVDRVIDPENTFDVIIGRPRVIVLKQVPARVQLEDETVARTTLLLADRQISVTGLMVGTTILNLWFGDPMDPAGQDVLSYLVRVLPDPEAKERLERVYDALAAEINRLFPDSVVRISLAGDKLVVSGQAKDIVEATQILRIVRSNAPGGAGGAAGGAGQAAAVPVTEVQVAGTTDVDPVTGALTTSHVATRGGSAPTLEDYLVAGGPNVINLLHVPGEQQVMLRVTVAEVDRAAARSIGVDFSISGSRGQPIFLNNTGRITNTFGGGGTGTGGVGGGGNNTFQGSNNLLAFLDNGKIFAAIAALRNLNLARTLAEPNLTTTNGQPASFRAGGQFPVPVVTGATSTGLQGVSFVPFGVSLRFTPFVTDKDRIRLIINSEVSVRDLGSSANVGNTSVPGLRSRNFQTTVELREGQTLAVAGLIQNDFGVDSSRVPLLGDLPVVGRLGAFDRTSFGEQELVVLITPELVHPYEPHSVPPLPGSDLFEPGDLEFFLLGRLESRRAQDYRSTVRTGLDRMARYRHCNDVFIQGPHGHSDGRH